MTQEAQILGALSDHLDTGPQRGIDTAALPPDNGAVSGEMVCRPTRPGYTRSQACNIAGWDIRVCRCQ